MMKYIQEIDVLKNNSLLESEGEISGASSQEPSQASEKSRPRAAMSTPPDLYAKPGDKGTISASDAVFVPKELVPRKYAGELILLAQSTWTKAKSHAFTINKNDIKNPNLSTKNKLNLMDEVHFASTQTNITLNEIQRIAKENGSKADHPQVESYQLDPSPKPETPYTAYIRLYHLEQQFWEPLRQGILTGDDSKAIHIRPNLVPLYASLVLTQNLKEATLIESAHDPYFRRKCRLGLIDRAGATQRVLLGELLQHYEPEGELQRSKDIDTTVHTIQSKCSDFLRDSITPLAFESKEHDIFTRVHQITEGLLEVMMDLYNELDDMPSLESVTARRTFMLLFHCYDAYVSIIQQLSSMNVGHYSELRVSLRDASGSQSKRAQARKSRAIALFRRYVRELREEGYSLFLTLFPNPSGAFERYGDTTDAFRVLGEAVQNTMKVHASMVAYTLGDAAIGTIGDQVLTLGTISSKPFFRELDAALLEFTTFSALQHGLRSGVTIGFPKATEN